MRDPWPWYALALIAFFSTSPIGTRDTGSRARASLDRRSTEAPVTADQIKAAVQARELLADTPEERHGVYPIRADQQDLKARAALHPVGRQTNIANLAAYRRASRDPEPPRAA